MALLTAMLPSTLATPSLTNIRPLLRTIRLYSSCLFGVYSSVNFKCFPLFLRSIAEESPTLAIVKWPFWIRLSKRVEPALQSDFFAISRNSESISW